MGKYRRFSNELKRAVYDKIIATFFMDISGVSTVYERTLAKERVLKREIDAWKEVGYDFSKEERAMFDFAFGKLAEDPNCLLTAESVMQGMGMTTGPETGAVERSHNGQISESELQTDKEIEAIISKLSLSDRMRSKKAISS